MSAILSGVAAAYADEAESKDSYQFVTASLRVASWNPSIGSVTSQE